MDKAEQILEKHINDDDLNFIFHEKKDLWQELLNATNEALGLAHVVEPKGKLFCNCELPSMDMRGTCFKCDREVDIKPAK